MKAIKHCTVAFLALISVWQLAIWLGNYQSTLFPSPLNVGRALIEMITGGTLFIDIRASLYRFAVGYLAAVNSGILLGLLFGWFPKVFHYVNPICQLIRPVSPIAWLPFIVLWFGIGDIPAIVIIFIAAFFPVLLTTVNAVKNIDEIYLKVAKNFDIKKHNVLFKIVFPASFPQIANSLHLALGSAWVFLVAGEMSGAQTGLGFLIIDARNNLRTDILLSTILIIGILGLLLDGLIKLFEKWVLTNWGIAPRERG